MCLFITSGDITNLNVTDATVSVVGNEDSGNDDALSKV